MPPWLESHADLRDHPKTDLLMELLAVTRRDACGLLHFIWWRALTYAPTGDLSSFTDSQVARWADWDGDPTLLLSGLKTAGFLDERRQIHDWQEYAGRWIDRREADAARKRDARKQAATRTSGGHPTGRRPESGVPDLTGPDRTLTGPDTTGHPSQTLPASGKGSAHHQRISPDVVETLSGLSPDVDAVTFQEAALLALEELGFDCEREKLVDSRGDGFRGRVDILAVRGDERLAIELDNQSAREKSIHKLSRISGVLKVIVLRGPYHGAVPPGLDAVIGNRFAPERPRRSTPDGRPAIPTDPAAYTSGEYGRIVAARMAARQEDEQ